MVSERLLGVVACFGSSCSGGSSWGLAAALGTHFRITLSLFGTFEALFGTFRYIRGEMVDI